jgi:hypothetical protein
MAVFQGWFKTSGDKAIVWFHVDDSRTIVDQEFTRVTRGNGATDIHNQEILKRTLCGLS